MSLRGEILNIIARSSTANDATSSDYTLAYYVKNTIDIFDRTVEKREINSFEKTRDLHDWVEKYVTSPEFRQQVSLSKPPPAESILNVPKPAVSDWVPMTNARSIAILGKLGEECTELAKICLRSMIQGGLDRTDPETGKINRLALEEEMADVYALTQIAEDRLHLNTVAMASRCARKVAHKEAWIASLSDSDK